MRFLKDESGQALLLVALSLVVILGFAGLAIDVGQLRYAQLRLQQRHFLASRHTRMQPSLFRRQRTWQ